MSRGAGISFVGVGERDGLAGRGLGSSARAATCDRSCSFAAVTTSASR